MKTNIHQFEEYIDDEFNRIMKDVKMHLSGSMSVKMKKEFLANHIPKEIIHSSEVLFSTVVNVLMSESRDKLKDAPVELQNRFYDYDFRKKLQEWLQQEGNKLDPESVKYSIITNFASFVEAFLSVVLKPILSISVFKSSYDWVGSKTISKMEEDIKSYLESSKGQLTKWIDMLIDYFNDEFKAFCQQNGLEVNNE